MWASQVVLVVKNPNPTPTNAGRCKRRQINPWVRKISWRRVWRPTPVFLPGESHGQRSLTGCSSQGCTKSDTTEATQHVCMVTPKQKPKGNTHKTRRKESKHTTIENYGITKENSKRRKKQRNCQTVRKQLIRWQQQIFTL